METGRAYFSDDDGRLWLAISYVDQAGVVTTQHIAIDEGENI